MSGGAESSGWLEALSTSLGEGGLWRPGVNADSAQLRPFLIDWRQRYEGRALAIARPTSTAQVAQVVRACHAQGVSIVTQGGNTGLVGGSVPDASGMQMLLSLQRLREIRGVDALNLSLSAEAGCTLHEVQLAAEQAGLLYPMSMASQGSCSLGGNLATNAGGTQVLRYGTARELCLGLEVVTPQGEIWSGLNLLRKNNTGYDLRDLFIGSEGTLGVITAASVRLYPQPQGRACALLSCDDLGAATALLQHARHKLSAGLVAFEVMAQLPLTLVQQHQGDAACAMNSLLHASTRLPPNWLVLIEHHSSESDTHAQTLLQTVLTDAMKLGWIDNASLAHNETQRQAMWQLREAIPLAEKAAGLMVKHDIGIPTSAIASFVAACNDAIHQRWPQANIVCFGHLGDGNLHYNVQPPAALSQDDAFKAFEQAVNTLVFDHVAQFDGTISAEHGIGALRRDELARRQSPVALALMHAIKTAIDPANIMNPGRVLA